MPSKTRSNPRAAFRDGLKAVAHLWRSKSPVAVHTWLLLGGGLEAISALEYPSEDAPGHSEDAAAVDRKRRERYGKDNAAAFKKDYDKVVAALNRDGSDQVIPR